MGLPEYNNANLTVVRRYFTGTNTLVAGQPLCYQETPASSTKGFGFDVEIPNTNNQNYFAGIVAPESVGVTGPAYIDVIVPNRGDILQVLIGDSAAVAAGDLLSLNFDLPTAAGTELGAFDYATQNTVTTSVAGSVAFIQGGRVRCQALESLASYTAAAGRNLKWVQFL